MARYTLLDAADESGAAVNPLPGKYSFYAYGTLLVPKDCLANPTDKRGRSSYCHEQIAFVQSLDDYEVDPIEWPTTEEEL